MNNDCKLPGTPPPLREHHFDYEKMAAVITMAREPMLVYEILDDNRRLTGSATYDTETDTVAIKHYTSSIEISGTSLRSLYFILGDLLSEVEQ